MGQKIAALAGRYGNQGLHKYVSSMASRVGIGDIPNNAFEFGGYTPTDGSDVYIWCSRLNGGTAAKYKKQFFDRTKEKIGWYAFSSPSEMFAEMYTRRYTVGGAGDAQADTWFTQLEASPGIVPGSFVPATPSYSTDPVFPGLLSQPTAAAGAATPVTEVEPPGNLAPSGWLAI